MGAVSGGGQHHPLVSVVIPAHDAGAYLRATLASALAQTHTHLEVLVVDDGSTDDTIAIVEAAAAADHRVRLFRQANRGVAAARNRAIANARGTYVAPLDADDLWHPEKIEKQVEALERGGETVALAYAWWRSVDQAGAVRYRARPWALSGAVDQALLSFNFIGNASVPLLRRTCVEAVGGYDETFRASAAQGCEDWDLALRLAERYRIGVVPDYLVDYRWVRTRMSADHQTMKRSCDLLIRKARERFPERHNAACACAESHFCSYLALSSWSDGRPWEACCWSTRAFLRARGVATPWRAAIALAALPTGLQGLARPLLARLGRPAGLGLDALPDLGAASPGLGAGGVPVACLDAPAD